MDFFKRIERLAHKHYKNLGAFYIGAAVVLVVAGGFVASGTTERLNHLLSLDTISPRSLTANIFPCTWFGDCGLPSQVVYGLIANTTSIAPGQPVTLTWYAYTITGATYTSSCRQGYPYPYYNCSLTGVGAVGTQCTVTPPTTNTTCTYDAYGNPSCNTVTTPGDSCSNFYSNDPTGSAVVYPAVTTTYSFCGTYYWGTPNGSSYGLYAYSAPCPSVTVTVPPPVPTCSLTPPTQSVTSPATPSISYSTSNTTAVAYAVDGVARGAPAGNPFVPTGATTVGSHNVIMTVTGPGGTATCGSNGNVVVNAPAATSCTLSPASQTIAAAQSANFTYTNPNAVTTTYSLDGGAPVVVTGGAFSVSGLSVGTHSVQLGVTNSTNSATCGAANNVVVTTTPLPTVSVTVGGASSVTVNPNQTTDLAWSVSGATAGTASVAAPSNSAVVTNFGSISGTQSTPYYASYIVAGGYIYRMGGYDGVNPWSNTLSRIPVSVDISTTGGWTTLGSVTAGASNIVGVNVNKPLVLNNTVYLFGGYSTGSGYTSTICSIPVANLGTPSGWTCPASLPSATNVAQAMTPPLIIGDYIYRIGGYNSVSGGSVASVARAPVSSPTSWTNYPNVLPIPIIGSAVAIVGNYVYIFGGNNSGAYTQTIYRALITSDLAAPSSWTASPGGVIPTAMYISEVAVDANYVYLIGGYNGTTYFSTIYKIARATLGAGNVTAGSWTSAGTLPVALASISSALYIGDKLYLMGGYGPTNGYVNKIYGLPFNAGLSYTTPSIPPWYTDNSRNTATTWPLVVPSVTYTAQGTSVSGQTTATAVVNKPDLCTNAPFTGIQNPMPSGVTAVGTTCSCTVGMTWTGSSCTVIVPTISSFFGPARVRSGNTATLSYTVVNPPASCSVTGNNGFSTTVSPISGVPGTVTTNAITANTQFTLTCNGVSVSATVGITPVFQEQ